jgi:hypothetical protein
MGHVKVSFKRRRDLRQGSPHQVCDLELGGAWRPRLERGGWLDVTARSPDGRFVGLVRWDRRGDTPGFRVVVLDTRSERVHRSRRFSGSCRALTWSGDGFDWVTSAARGGRYKPLPLTPAG